MNKWKKMWNQESRIDEIILGCLINADGFHGDTGCFSVGEWSEYTNMLYKKIGIQEHHSVFDVGCGSGAFIYPLNSQGHFVGGSDYSSPLIELARRMFRSDKFICEEALNLSQEPLFDIVMSHSVFQYFPDMDYAEKIVKNMVNKSRYKAAFLDLNDASKEGIYHNVRMENIDNEKYKNKYAGLKHTFYRKDWFQRIANELGMKIEIFNQDFGSYVNSDLRFNVVMSKK